MKLLFQSALRNAKHFSLALITMAMLLFLTVANQMEMFALGMMANTGVDFFTLFGDEKEGQIQSDNQVSFSTVEEKWSKIDKHATGSISKQAAINYLGKRKEANLLSRMSRAIFSKLKLDLSFQGVIMVLVLVAVIKAFFLFFSRYTTKILSIRITKDLRQQYFEHIQSQPMSFYLKHPLGALSSRSVGDAGQISSSLNSCLTNYIHTPFTLLSTLGMCFYLSWKLSLVIFIGIPLVIYPVVLITKKVKKVGRQLQRNQEKFSSVLLDFLAGIQTVKIYAMEAFSLKKFKEQNEEMAYLESKSAKYDLLTRPILHTITTACLASVALYGLYSLNMSLAELLVFVGLLHVFYEPVRKFAEENANIQKGVVAAERMFEVMNLKPEIMDAKNATNIKSFEKEISFEDVWFKYGNEWVLKGVSFNIEKGSTVAFVGATGAGKSTIAQLIPRLYEVQKGIIKIDGKPVSSYTQKSLRELISYVPQKPFLFYDTVAQNIAFGRDFSKEMIKDAAIKAFADEFILDLPNGYDTLLAETGKSLSGGQQQRLAIARALVKKGPILMLDEATSSLDAISENRIKQAIHKLHGQITQILIAHRLSTIEYADKIIFLQDGKKLAEGTIDHLLETCPSFKLMWDAYHRSTKKLSKI